MIISHVCLDFVELLTSLLFLTQFPPPIHVKFCSLNNGGRFHHEYTGKIIILLVGILPKDLANLLLRVSTFNFS